MIAQQQWLVADRLVTPFSEFVATYVRWVYCSPIDNSACQDNKAPHQETLFVISGNIEDKENP
ncbi:hypothetical protein HC02_17685 [Vibrio parahaemolyticus]|nr:hypothetical protein HC02_17685 [Vibrio parahaemolyticus]